MTTLYDNFEAGTTTDNPLTSGATTINSSEFANLPTVTSPDIMYLVLDPDASAGAPEIVTVTAHSASATSVTVTRASQSTTARSHASGTVWRASLTKADADAWAAILEDGAIDTVNLAADAVTAAKILDGAVTKDKWGESWTSFTPGWNNVTQGSGATNSGRYMYVPGGMRVQAFLQLGTGGSVSAAVTLTIPNSETHKAGGIRSFGEAWYYDDDTGTRHKGHASAASASTEIQIYREIASTTTTTVGAVTASQPFTWAASDLIDVDIVVAL